jgi:mannose-6-phosphate isomerase
MVWGGRRLETVLGKRLPTPEPYGESWEVSDHAMHQSVVATGPGAGRTLRHLMQSEPASLLGRAAGHFSAFPWLIKFLDAQDWLSVQVHPDDEWAKRLWPGERGKTEAWFVLDALPGSKVWAGLLPGTNATRVREALAAGAVADCLHSFTPRPGECLFLPAGTVHAVGGGVLMAEVQQTSDATFRLFDWNRRDAQGKSRTLHVEESLTCIDWSRGPVEPMRVPGFDSGAGGAVRMPLVSCRYFNLEYRSESSRFRLGGEGRLQVVLVLRGQGNLATPAGDEALRVGQSWVLPAHAATVECRPVPSLSLLLCTLPD